MGHITPLIAIARHYKDYDITYFGLKDSFEENMCKKYNIKFYSLTLYPFYRKNIFKNIKTFIYIYRMKNKIKKDYNGDAIIFTTGGFVSIPLILAFKKSKKYLIESNITAGLAAKFLSLFKITFLSPYPLYNVRHTINVGLPYTVDTFKEYPIFYSKRKKVLFIAGSQGALEILDLCYKFSEKYRDVDVMVVTGKRYYDKYNFNNNVTKISYFFNAKEIFKFFDLVISRAGGATLFELVRSKACSLIIPSKNVTNDHQSLNAKYLEGLGLVKIINAKDYEIINKILYDNEYLNIWKEKLNDYHYSDFFKYADKYIFR